MRLGLAVVVGLLGCGPVVELPADATGGQTESAEGPMTTGVPGSGSSGTSGTTVPGTTVGPTTVPATTTTDASSSGEDVESGGFPCGFICPPDFIDPISCDTWDPHCVRGEKCMPWSNDGSSTWNATRCSGIVEDPQAVGDPCVVYGSPYSGADNCDATSMCFDVDPDTLEGTCHAFCGGDPSNPTCPGACDTCTATGDGVLNLCVPGCDPIAQDCSSGSPCYFANGYFACVPDASGDGGAVGQPCETIDGCDPGLACISGAQVPGCDDAGCCVPYCVVGDPTPCEALPGSACVPLFPDGPPNACVAPDVGACMNRD